MEEGQVTVDGITHKIPQPFIVIATQNPTGAAGTQPLPDSQTDRFMIRLSLGYPALEDEISMLSDRQGKEPLRELRALITPEELKSMQELVAQTYISPEIVRYIVTLVQATRTDPMIIRGASPRATLAVASIAKALARLYGRDFVIPEDVQNAYPATLAHRIELSAKAGSQTTEQVLMKLLQSVSAPKI